MEVIDEGKSRWIGGERGSFSKLLQRAQVIDEGTECDAKVLKGKAFKEVLNSFMIGHIRTWGESGGEGGDKSE